VTTSRLASTRASNPKTPAPAVASRDVRLALPSARPAWLSACGVSARADWVPARGAVPTAGLGAGLGVITGSMLDMFPATTSELDTGSMVGIGASVGSPAGVGGTARAVAGADVAARGDDGEGAGLLDDVAGTAVTVTAPAATACVVIGGLVAASADAVRVTDDAPLDGVPIWASRVNDDGVTSVPSGPSWHEAVPSPLGHKPVNTAWPADAVSVTDTSGAAPFSAWTWTVNPAA